MNDPARYLLLTILLLCGCSNDGSMTPAQQPSNTNVPQNPPPATQPPPSPPPAAPTVNAGPDQTVKLGNAVHLSGSSTTTEQNPTYLWQFVSVPMGSGAVLANPTTLTPTFPPDLAGIYIVSLTLVGGPTDQVSIEVQANLLTLHFSGTFGPDGTVDGTFTYEITQGPNATNVRSLQPNVLYRLTSWNLVVNSGQVADLLPSTVFDSSQPNNTVEFCEGICLFSATQVAELRFQNTGPDMLTIQFQHQDPTPFINPPGSLSEWGPFFQATYRVPNSVPLAILHTGSLTES